MKSLRLSLILLLPAAARAAIVFQSAAFEQAQQIDGAQDPEGKTETAKAKGSLGFTVQTLEPVGYVSAGGKQPVEGSPRGKLDQEIGTPPAGNATTGSGHYVFEGKSPLKGVTIYTPKDDPTGNGRTSKDKPEGPVSKKLMYGALGLGAAATIGGLFFAPLLFLGGLLLGAGAVMLYINKKYAK